MDHKTLIKNILNDIKVELKDEFDKNFERKGFFSSPWQRKKRDDGYELLTRTGALRRSIKATTSLNSASVIFSSELPYAQIHNQGGRIVVTAKMKRFFWAMHYKHSSGIKLLKSGAPSKSRSMVRESDLAQFYKAMALKRVGSKITIPQRQFIGRSPEVDQIIAQTISKNINEFLTAFSQQLNNTASK